ncbi:uncharacterized protein LOC111334939 [Stylophora pistillata]|uniref:uncharacterized protein LOC111334939 n=1 Tax=Stylophora pistillata TaxID=50429 RepID=UPI000C047884|nr:uncharacterized protein LOC111334939 [Stylophora pistillata]
MSERYERTAKTLKLRAQNATLWRKQNNESLRLVWQREKICRKLTRVTHLYAINTNVPTCAADGSYDSKQCTSSRKFCWCVDKNGRPREKMQIKRYEELNCSKTAADHEKRWTCSSLLRSGQKTRRICRKHVDCSDSKGMCCRSSRSRNGNKVCLDPPPKMPEKKPGLCPDVPTSPTYSCKSQCETDANCEGEHKCCMMGCGKTCVPPNEPVCPKDKPFKLCIYDKCLSSPGCFNHPSAYCRMNYCGGCTAEYFNNYNRKVDCINGTQCQTQRHLASEIYKKKFFGVFGSLPMVIPGSQVEDYSHRPSESDGDSNGGQRSNTKNHQHGGSVGGQHENGGGRIGSNVRNHRIENGYPNGVSGASGSSGSSGSSGTSGSSGSSGSTGYSGSTGSSGSSGFRTRRRGKRSINGFRNGDQSGQEGRTSKRNESNRREVDLGVFVPVCDSRDGEFIPEQCNATAGVCWCVDGNGQEIVNTREKVPRGK